MEVEEAFNENDTTRTSLGKVIKAIQRIEARQKKMQEFMIRYWTWKKKIQSFGHSEAEKIRLDD